MSVDVEFSSATTFSMVTGSTGFVVQYIWGD